MVVLYFSIRANEDKRMDGRGFTEHIKKNILQGLHKKVINIEVNFWLKVCFLVRNNERTYFELAWLFT